MLLIPRYAVGEKNASDRILDAGLIVCLTLLAFPGLALVFLSVAQNRLNNHIHTQIKAFAVFKDVRRSLCVENLCCQCRNAIALKWGDKRVCVIDKICLGR